MAQEYKSFQLRIRKQQCFITGEEWKEVSLPKLAEAIVSGKNDYESFIQETEINWRESVREFGEYGPTTLIDCIVNPDGSELDVDLNKYYPDNFEPQDGDSNIGEIGTFTEFRFIVDKGIISDYSMDLEKEFNSNYLKPVFNDRSMCGIISHYEYDNKADSDSEFFIESEIEEWRPSMGGGIYLFYNSEQGLNQLWGFDELKKEMNSDNIDFSELSGVVQFLESKYKKKVDDSEVVSEDDNSPWCDKCNGEGYVGPLLEEKCNECNGSGMSDPVYH